MASSLTGLSAAASRASWPRSLARDCGRSGVSVFTSAFLSVLTCSAKAVYERPSCIHSTQHLAANSSLQVNESFQCNQVSDRKNCLKPRPIYCPRHTFFAGDSGFWSFSSKPCLRDNTLAGRSSSKSCGAAAALLGVPSFWAGVVSRPSLDLPLLFAFLGSGSESKCFCTAARVCTQGEVMHATQVD